MPTDAMARPEPTQTLGGRADPGRVVRCPACGGGLSAGETQWLCTACAHRWPATLGIPDLRVPSEAQSELAMALAAAWPDHSFEQLLPLFAPRYPSQNPKLVARYEDYMQRRVERGEGYYAMIRARVREVHGEFAAKVALDLGCGIGSCTAALARDFDHVVAIDPSLPDLILARKSLEELDIRNVTLIQAYAQDLPLASGSVDFAIAENVLEHLITVDAAFEEVARVLKPGAVFAGDSHNRFDLLRPEPHVLLHGVGFLPRGWQGRYVRWRRGDVDYEGFVRLLSYRELRGALRRWFGSESRVVAPKVAFYGFPAGLDRLLAVVERIPVVRDLMLTVFPAHLALARKSAP